MRHINLIGLLLPLLSQSQSGLELINASAAKIKTLHTIRYNIHMTSFIGQASADVSIQRGGELPIFETARIRVSGISLEADGSKQVNFSYDGRSFDFYDNKRGQLTSIDSPTYNKLGRVGLMQYTGLALIPYWQKIPFENVLQNIILAEKLNDTTIFNVPCYKIKAVREVTHELFGKKTFESNWFIDKKTLLVCGLTSTADKYFLKITAVDTAFSDTYFSLSSSTEVKRISGTEPITEGLLAIGTKAPDWKLPSSLEKNIGLDDLKGKVVLLDFWGTWCFPCLKAMPEIQSIHDHFKNEKVMVIGVSVETEKAADPLGYVKRKGYTYPIVLDGDHITKPYKVVQFPTIYIIDKKGKIIHAEHSGNRENFKEDIIKRINDALKAD